MVPVRNDDECHSKGKTEGRQSHPDWLLRLLPGSVTCHFCSQGSQKSHWHAMHKPETYHNLLNLSLEPDGFSSPPFLLSPPLATSLLPRLLQQPSSDFHNFTQLLSLQLLSVLKSGFFSMRLYVMTLTSCSTLSWPFHCSASWLDPELPPPTSSLLCFPSLSF